MQYRGSFPRDANHVPDVSQGCLSTDSQTLVGASGTIVVPIFTISGSIEVRGIWGVVTTVIGVNHTASAFRFNDATVHSDITLSTGTDISVAPVGSLIVKKGVAATAIALVSSSQERVSEPTTLETLYFSPFVLTAKTAVTTNIEYVYATTDNPTTGAIQFFMRWIPLTNDAQVTSL